jgi:hypothetical protein
MSDRLTAARDALKALHDFLWDEMEWFSDESAPMPWYTTMAHGQKHDDLVERFHDAYPELLAAAEAPGRVVALVQRAEADQRRAFEWLSGDICVYLSGGGTCYRGPEDPCHKNVEAWASMRSHRYVTALDMDAASIVKRARAILAAPASPAGASGEPETDPVVQALRRWLRDDPWVPLAWEGARILSWECYACEATLTLPEHVYITPEDAGHIDGTGREERCLWLVTREALAAPASPAGASEFRALVDEARANHVRWEHEAEVLEECIRPLCIGAKVLLWPDIENPRTSAIPAPAPRRAAELTAAGRNLLRSWTEPNDEQLAERSAWTRDWLALRLPDIEAEAAARAVDEALSVERVADALAALSTSPSGVTFAPAVFAHRSPAVMEWAAALVAHLRGPR